MFALPVSRRLSQATAEQSHVQHRMLTGGAGKLPQSSLTSEDWDEREPRIQAQSHKSGQGSSAASRGIPLFANEDQVQAKAPESIGLQAKLVVGRADDPLEREADRVAARVMLRGDQIANGFARAPNSVQRKCEACEQAEHRPQQGTDPTVAQGGRTAPVSVDEALAVVGRPLDF